MYSWIHHYLHTLKRPYLPHIYCINTINKDFIYVRRAKEFEEVLSKIGKDVNIIEV